MRTPFALLLALAVATAHAENMTNRVALLKPLFDPPPLEVMEFGCQSGAIMFLPDIAELPGLERTLAALRMTPGDLAFKKDVVESEFVSWSFIEQPLLLTGHSHRLMVRLGLIRSLTDWDRFMYGEPFPEGIECPRRTPQWQFAPEFLERLPTRVATSVWQLASEAIEVGATCGSTNQAAVRSALFNAFAVDTFRLERDKAEMDAWDAVGFKTTTLRELVRSAENLELQDDELVQPFLGARFELNLWSVFRLLSAVDVVVANLQKEKFTERFQYETDTPLGKIIVGGVGDNVYTNDAFLVIDLGGHNRFENNAGGANGLIGRPVAICIALGGENEYISRRSFTQGAGLFGIGILADYSTNATFVAKHLSQGAGFFGCGLLATGPGRHKFEADTFCQGAGMFGAGILWQRGGDTTYRAAERAQGYGGTLGVGVLLDESGNDSYFAGGKYPCRWLDDHKFSLAQGMGMGMRPFAGGGVGILCDFTGDDHYEADVYGQGVGYWYATGFLLDLAGNDTYKLYQYGQGAGIHLAAGLLEDGTGNDTYTAHAICQGGAHDYSVGMLLDHAGNDKYTADSTAQGGAINNSFAMLFDRQGEDSYTGTSTNQSQASGHDGGRREYGSIALLLDLAGKDVYSQGWTNNSLWTKPNHGAGLDGEFWSAPTCRRFAFSAPGRTGQRQSASKLAHSKVDVRHPIERLLRRATRDWETDAEKADSEAADKELNDRATEALPYLLTRLGSPNVMVSVKAEQLVDKLGTNAVPLLIQGIKVAGNDDVARRCAFFLGRFESATNAIPVLLPLLTNETTRTTALYTLGHLRAREAFGPALRGLGDEKEMVRLRAAQALGRIGDRRAVPKLIGMLGDPLWDVRYAAEDALVALGAPSRQLLRAEFADATPLTRRYIASALVRLGDPAGRPLARVAERKDERE